MMIIIVVLVIILVVIIIIIIVVVIIMEFLTAPTYQGKLTLTVTVTLRCMPKL